MIDCDECKAQTRWLTVTQATGIVQRSERTIYRWIEEGVVHVRQLPCGRGQRICENSLLRKNDGRGLAAGVFG